MSVLWLLSVPTPMYHSLSCIQYFVLLYICVHPFSLFTHHTRMSFHMEAGNDTWESKKPTGTFVQRKKFIKSPWPRE